MKKSILIIGFLAALVGTIVSPNRASAATGSTGWAQVEMIASASQNGAYGWISLVGVNTAGACATFTPPGGSQAKPIFMVNVDDRGKTQMSLLESALLSGKSIWIDYNTSITLLGYCQAVNIYIK